MALTWPNRMAYASRMGTCACAIVSKETYYSVKRAY